MMLLLRCRGMVLSNLMSMLLGMLLLLLLLLLSMVLSSLSTRLSLQISLVCFISWLFFREKCCSGGIESVILSGIGKENIRLIGLLRWRRWQVNCGVAINWRVRMRHAIFVGDQNLILIIQNVVSISCSRHLGTFGCFFVVTSFLFEKL